MTFPDFRLSARVAALGALLALGLTQCSAADPTERPYDPPAGSRWLIESQIKTDDNRPEGARSSQIKMRAELTIDEKTPDGFRITYINRGATMEGNDTMLPILRTAVKALENVAIRATADRSGKPVRVENLDEAKTAMRSMRGSFTERFKDKPQVAAVLAQMLDGMIEVDADKAAEAYFDDVPLLAKAQNTGMKLHEVRRSSRAVDNPLGNGGAMKSNDAFELTEIDSATGKRVLVNTTAYDPASMKEFTQSLAKKLMAAAGSNVKLAEIDSLMKSMVLTLDNRGVFEVEDGMTRKVTEKSVTTVRAMGHNLQKTEEKTVTVTRAP